MVGWGKRVCKRLGRVRSLVGRGFSPYRWNFDARAAEPVKVLALAGKALRDRCDQDPRLGYQLMKRFAEIMVSRLRATRLQVLDVYGRKNGKS